MRLHLQIYLFRKILSYLCGWRGDKEIFWTNTLGKRIGASLLLIRRPCWVALLLCVSCMGGGNSNDPAAVATKRAAAGLGNVALVTVEMYDNYYGDSDSNLTDPPVWTVQSGADVVATLTNHGRRKHNWAIIKQGVQIPVPYEDGQGGDIILHGIGMVYGNSQTTITFTAPEPGEYMIICTVTGHYPAMQGRLQVTGPE